MQLKITLIAGTLGLVTLAPRELAAQATSVPTSHTRGEDGGGWIRT